MVQSIGKNNPNIGEIKRDGENFPQEIQLLLLSLMLSSRYAACELARPPAPATSPACHLPILQLFSNSSRGSTRKRKKNCHYTNENGHLFSKLSDSGGEEANLILSKRGHGDFNFLF